MFPSPNASTGPSKPVRTAAKLLVKESAVFMIKMCKNQLQHGKLGRLLQTDTANARRVLESKVQHGIQHLRPRTIEDA